MKMSDFNSLCSRVWDDPLGRRGDILELHLTDDSKRELCADALTDVAGNWQLMMTMPAPAPLERMRAGAIVTEAVNPITRTVIKVRGGSTADEALVKFAGSDELQLIAA